MSDQRSNDLVAVDFRNLEEGVDIPGWIDHEDLAALGVAQEVHKVSHLPSHRIDPCQVLPGEELAKIKMLFLHALASFDGNRAVPSLARPLAPLQG